MARRKGRKSWEGISREGWLSLYGNTDIMTDLMMDISDCLYHSRNCTDNAKHIAEKLHMEYRALNAAVGWAGNKIHDLVLEAQANPSAHPEIRTDEPPAEDMAPWEFVFDGVEDEEGTYLWIMKPEALSAFRELTETRLTDEEALYDILSRDISSYGREGSLFSATPDQTVDAIRQRLEERKHFRRKSLGENPQCAVCGLRRRSMLRAVPYGDETSLRQKGIMLCPTHASLFAAHLISFSDKGELLVSDWLSPEEQQCMGIKEGMPARTPFSRRRMTLHRRLFNKEGRKKK
jgi:hypothetical protein